MAIARIHSPNQVRLTPNLPQLNGPMTVVVTKNEGSHSETIGVYLAFLPPGGADNPGDCGPNTVLNWTLFSIGQSVLTNVDPGDRVRLTARPPWQCSNPAAVAGQNWTLVAIADHGGDDFASCDTLAEVFDATCSLALVDDDDDASDNMRTRARPIVKLQ